MSGLILAAPASGAGKTTITLGILRALTNVGHKVTSAKSGPDYIDPQFHAAATGAPCLNLDAWAMTPAQIKSLAAGPHDLIIEGAMGLFDGAPPLGAGSSADLARILNLPVILIVDARAMSQSIAALVSGFANHDPHVRVAGVILNRVGSDRHAAMLRSALAPFNIPVLGAIPRSDDLARPSRHLGLVQAGEMTDLDSFLNTAAAIIAKHIDLTAVRALMGPIAPADRAPDTDGAPTTIAIAHDAAFSFIYPHQIAEWHRAGAKITYFSPLADNPVPNADQIFLPGGYPELHAARLARNQTFMQSLRNAAQTSDIYGECGGYMTLGQTLIDADGTAHDMAGLLDLTTSFADRKRHLGYRNLTRLSDNAAFKAHEFHYATTLEIAGTPLFHAFDAENNDLGQIGLRKGRVAGSFAHIITHNTTLRNDSPLP